MFLLTIRTTWILQELLPSTSKIAASGQLTILARLLLFLQSGSARNLVVVDNSSDVRSWFQTMRSLFRCHVHVRGNPSSLLEIDSGPVLTETKA